MFGGTEAKRIVDIGLRNANHYVRASAFQAVLALAYISGNGGSYTPQLGREIIEQRLASITIGSGVPSRYPEQEYFIGNTIFADTARFARRLEELWQTVK